MEITAALATLDPLDDSHWTTDGAPRLDVVSARVGGTVTRQQVRAVAPEFSRDRLDLPGAKPAAAEPPKAPPVPSPAAAEDADADKVEDPPAEAPAAESEAPAEPAPLARLRELDAQITKLRAQREAIDNELGQLAREQAHLQPQADRLVDRNADQKARMEFIAAEQSRKLARAGQVVAAAGVAGVAPIDRAFGRRNARGGQRPSYPAPKLPE